MDFGCRRRGLALCAILLLTAACSQIENPRILSPEEPSVQDVQSRKLQRLQFEDLPVPRGFLYVTRGNRSFSYQAGGVRVGQFVYWGRLAQAEVEAFYRETMVLDAYGWSYQNSRPSDNGVVMSFKKNQQSCDVTVEEEAKGTYVTVFVTGPA
jgi:hypothetical protein